MRPNIINTCLIFFILLSNVLIAQYRAPNGGGEMVFPTVECISHEQSEIIVEELRQSIQELTVAGLITDHNTEVVTKLSWPLKQASGFDQFDYYATINYLDLDATNAIQDYNCGQRSYDGHNGIDYSLWPFWWKMMEEDQVEVIASAPGMIILKQDGNFDMNCSCTGQWNAVYVQHQDGSIAWYGHLKTGSLTDKDQGAMVAEGEYLGLVGSSGCSSNPHLHFELRNSDFEVIEPYAGPCNQTVQESWWDNQEDYREPGLNLLMTHSENPNLNNGFCPEDENPNFETEFEPGDIISFGAYYHDQIANEATNYVIKKPNGTVFNQWDHASPETYSSSWWYWFYQFPFDSDLGTWTFEATFLSETFVHEFNLSMDVATDDLMNHAAIVYPNPTNARVQFVWNNFEPVNYQVINLEGKMLQQGSLTSSNESINLETLTSGIYFLEFVDKNNVVSYREKLIKTNY